MAVVGSGKPAITHYRVRERFPAHTLLECDLETGRTHQIRVHLASIGHPLEGDPAYAGRGKAIFPRQALHAWQLAFVHPVTGDTLRFESPLPADFRGLLDSKKQPITLNDPLKIGIVDNQIPKSQLSAQTQAFLNFEPLPNTSNGAFNYLTTAASAVSRQKNFTTRVDHNLSSKDQISGRYVINDTYEAGTPIGGHDERSNIGRTQNVSASWTRTISPALVNKTRASLGLTGNLRGKSKKTKRAPGGKAASTGKRRGRPPKQATAAVNERRGRKGGRTLALEGLDAEVDRLLFRVMEVGGLPKVEESLRQARRLLYAGFSRG
jgi:hypothetical protein